MKEKLEVFAAQNQADLRGCTEVLERVRREELNRVAGKSVLDSHALQDVKTNYALMACRNNANQQIIGCIRITPASEVAHLERSVKEYCLDLFPAHLLSKIVILTRLAVLPEYRGSKASFLLMMEAVKHHISNGGLATLATCEPSLYQMYLKLGLRPIGHIHNSVKSGYRIPLIGFVDLAYFKEIRSPAYAMLRRVEGDANEEVKTWYKNHVSSGKIDHIGIHQYAPQPADLPLYKELIEDLSEGAIQKLTRNAFVLSCKKGEVIIPDQDGGKFLGLVYKGTLAVEKGNKVLAKLSKGALFGELALITKNYRTARVTAAEDSLVIILAKSALSMPKAEDELTIWKNLARIIAHKLLKMNQI